MKVAQFEESFKYAREYYAKDASMKRCVSDFIEANDDANVKLYRRFNSETALFELEDGTVQVDAEFSAYYGAYRMSMGITAIYQ